MSSDGLDPMDLDANPFAVLDVTTRDTRERIYDAVEDRSLVVDPNACNEARAVLTAPRRRFSAELGWFPGVAPSTARTAASAQHLRDVRTLPLTSLGLANALTGCARRNPPQSVDDVAAFLNDVSMAVDAVESAQVIRDVNEDREIAGFPAFTSMDAASEALSERRQGWLSGVMSILDRLPTLTMAEGMFRTAEDAAESGSFSPFMHELVEKYALRTQPFLQQEMAGAQRLIDKAKSIAGDRPDALTPLIDSLGELLETWESTTKPTQLSLTALGRTDRDSEKIAYMVRNLSIDLHNQHDLTDHAMSISELLGDRFASLPGFSAKIKEDQAALRNFAVDAKRLVAENSYAAEVGTFKKIRLAITPTMLEWSGERYDISQIGRARWGSLSKSVNGVPTGTDYLIEWSDGSRTATVKIRNETIYDAFVKRLWLTLGPSITERMIAQLRAGERIHCGDAVVSDQTILLPSRKLFGEKRAEYSWSQITTNIGNGRLIITGPAKSSATASLSFRDNDNVHFLEMILRTAMKNGSQRLSEAFI